MSVTIISKTGIYSLSVDDYRAAMPCAEGFENAEHLPFPKSMQLAPQIREMGINLGDTIVGREGDKEETWWSEKRLTLLWVGQTAAVFRVARRNKSVPTWHEEGEATNWTLDSRKWFLANTKNVSPAPVGSGGWLASVFFSAEASDSRSNTDLK